MKTKKNILQLAVIILTIVTSNIFGQVDTNFYQFKNYFFQGYDGTIDTNEAGPINKFLKYEYINGPKFSPTGSIQHAAKAIDAWVSHYELNGKDISDLESNWISLGPNKTPYNPNGASSAGVGRLSCIEFDPINPSSVIYAGSPFGGVWKTINGGTDWVNLNTDFIPVIKTSDIAINPNNNNMIFIATGDRDDYKNASISAGVYRSIDGGLTWQAINIGLDYSGFFQISKILINPTNPDIIYLATSNGIYKTLNGTTTCQWNLLTDPLVYQQYFRNIIFKPDGQYSTIYASGKDIIKTTTGGDTWNSTGLNFNNPPFSGLFPVRINIDVTPASQNVIYASAIFSNTSGQLVWNSLKKHFIFKFDGNTWTFYTPLPSNQEPGYYYQTYGIGPAMMSIAVSPIDDDLVFFGNVIAWRSTDGGENFNAVYNYYLGDAHPDTRFLKFSPDGQTLYFANDGGFQVVTDPNYTTGPTWNTFNNGLAIGTVQKIGISEIDNDLTLIGNFDVSSALYDPEYLPPGESWKQVGAGDGCEQIIDYLDNDKMYSSAQKNTLTRSFTRGNGTWTPIDRPYDPGCGGMEKGEFVGDYIIHPTIYNVLYINYTDLYKYTFTSSSSYYKEQVSFFENDFGLNCYDPLIAIGMAPNKPEYIYVAVENIHDPDPSDYKLFMTTTGGYDNGCFQDCWTELFPPNPHYITGIAVSPYNENEFWLSYSGYDENDKVKYFDGNSWSDFSFGLPNLPVNNIIYRYGSNNGLFAGTDIGVYYRDASMNQWESFMNNLPNVMVTELEISYSNNTIKAGTYGRGLWESSLPCNLSNESIEIISDQNWNVPMRIEGDVIVKTGQTLTIYNTASIYFTDESKLIVERGGHLIIDGGTLTGSCGLMWQGVEVQGTATASQNTTDQGEIQIINGGTIENAVCAIQTIKFNLPDGGGDETPNYSYTGGIVLCDAAIFKNNNTAVKFWAYDYAASKSLFKNCQFITNDDLLETADPDNFFEMTGISGITIGLCNFTDFRAIVDPVDLTSGIVAHDASFKVFAASVFTDLYYGIKAFAQNPEKTVTIQSNQFTGDYRGIYISGMSNAQANSNNFSINSPYSENDGGYGLYLDYCTAYNVEENNFYHETGGQVGVGLVVNNSGTDPNRIYRNLFTQLECGMDIQGENRAKDGTGLQLLCNQYEGTKMDKIITWEIPLVNPFAGIASSQGSSSSNPEDMAGNLFFIPEEPIGDNDDILNEGNHITYYYPQYYNDIRVIPVDFTSNTTDIKEVDDIIWTFENGCPPNENGGGGGGTGTDDGLKSSMAQTDQKIDSTSNLLAMLIDGGNTVAVQTGVETSVPPETMQVYTDLMNKSPYLSDTVVSTAIVKENVLPAAMIRDIMVANPKSAKSEVLINKLDQRFDPLPAYMKGQILQGRSIVSIREETESRLASFSLKRAGYFSALVRYYLNDTVNPQASLDSLKAVLQTENSLNAQYMLAFLQARQGDWAQGTATLNAIPSAFELTAAQQTVHQQLTDYFSLLSNLATDNNSVMEADSAQIATLKTIEQADAGIVSVYARNILLALNQSDYEEPIILPDMLKAAAISEDYQKLINKAEKVSGMLTVRPNPAKDYVIVGYDFETETTAVIEITGADGKAAYSKKVNGQKDQFTVDTRQWKAGLYVATVKINGKIIESFKFTVVR